MVTNMRRARSAIAEELPEFDDEDSNDPVHVLIEWAERHRGIFNSLKMFYLHEEEGWGTARLAADMWLNNHIFDMCLSMVLLFNVSLIIIETDCGAVGNEREPAAWLEYGNNFLMVVYLLELCIRLFAYRRAYFGSMANLVDGTIILIDLVGNLIFKELFNISWMRLFRLLRLGRAVRLLTMFPELSTMLAGLMHAMRSILWGMLLVVAMLTMWSILAVQLIHPINYRIAQEGVYGSCARCPHAFESTWMSLLTFTQHIIAGDSWGNVSLDIIEAESWTFFFFIGVVASVGMGIMNLILAVIVDNSMEARKLSDEALSLAKEEEWQKASEQLQDVCISIDKDRNGVLTLPEIIRGYRTNEMFRHSMKVMDLTEEDMKVVFHILDEDKSGDVHYTEFIKNLYKLKSSNERTMQVFMQYYVQEILHRATRHLAVTKDEIQKSLREMVADLQSLKQATGVPIARPAPVARSYESEGGGPVASSRTEDQEVSLQTNQSGYSGASTKKKRPVRGMPRNSALDQRHQAHTGKAARPSFSSGFRHGETIEEMIVVNVEDTEPGMLWENVSPTEEAGLQAERSMRRTEWPSQGSSSPPPGEASRDEDPLHPKNLKKVKFSRLEPKPGEHQDTLLEDSDLLQPDCSV